MRFLRTSQVAKLFGTSRSAANKRLRVLLDAGWVRAWVRSLSSDNVYSVTRAAIELIAEQEKDRGVSVRIPRELDGNLDHLLSINQVRIALALGLSEVGGAISWWRSDWELPRQRWMRLVPDAVFTLRWDDTSEKTFSLELDHRKKSPRNFLHKMLAYASFRQQRRALHGAAGIEAVLAVGHDPRWVERYRAAAGHVLLNMPTWFATLQAVDTTPAGAIWRPVNADTEYSLRDLCFLPCRKEGLTDETVGVSHRSGAPSARIWPYGDTDTDVLRGK